MLKDETQLSLSSCLSILFLWLLVGSGIYISFEKLGIYDWVDDDGYVRGFGGELMIRLLIVASLFLAFFIWSALGKATMKAIKKYNLHGIVSKIASFIFWVDLSVDGR